MFTIQVIGAYHEGDTINMCRGTGKKKNADGIGFQAAGAN